MEKVCPRCKYPQEGIDKCEYCGLVFAQYDKTQITKESNWKNAIDKKSSLLNIIISLIALIGFFGLVYFWYQHESAKKMAELEEIRKPKINEQKRKQKQQPAQIRMKQQNGEKDNKEAVIPTERTHKTIPLADTSENRNIESETKNSIPAANKTQKAVSPAITKVFCGRFKVNSVLKGKELQFWLDTDLPYDTIVIVRVSRPYWIKGSSGTYFGSYYGQSRSVLRLRTPVTVILDDNEWRKQLEKKHELIEPGGEPLQVSKVSDEVELSLTVPINQDNPAFGRKNVNLEGTMVTAKQGFKIIREERMFLVPFGKAISTTSPAKTK